MSLQQCSIARLRPCVCLSVRARACVTPIHSTKRTTHLHAARFQPNPATSICSEWRLECDSAAPMLNRFHTYALHNKNMRICVCKYDHVIAHIRLRVASSSSATSRCPLATFCFAKLNTRTRVSVHSRVCALLYIDLKINWSTRSSVRTICYCIIDFVVSTSVAWFSY